MWYKVKLYLEGGFGIEAESEDDAIAEFLEMVTNGEVGLEDFTATPDEEDE